MGGDLAVISSDSDNKFIYDLLTNQNTVTDLGAWIGLQKKTSDSPFYWIDGSPIWGKYTGWAKSQPDNKGGQENCVNMIGKGLDAGGWNDLDCDVRSCAWSDVPVVLCQKPI